MSIYQPYTYLIGWSKHSVFYYGVRYAKKCHPDDLWVTYFTSSKSVKTFRKEHGEPDIVEVRRTFDCYEKAILWEYKVLRRMNVVKDKKWLNKHSTRASHIETLWQDPIFRDKITSSLLEAQNRPEVRHKRSETFKELWKDPNYRESQAQSMSHRLEKMTTAEARKKNSDAVKSKWSDKEYRNKTVQSMNRPETKQLKSEISKKRWQDPVWREKELARRKQKKVTQ